MKQAVLITAYKNYSHLSDLIDFFDSNFSIYLHIDKKSNISNSQIEVLRNKKNVSYVFQKYKVNWGGINHLKAILMLAETALADSQNIYFHLITGHDYPIKDIKYITSFVKENRDKDFMEYNPLPYTPWPEGGMDRLTRFNMYDLIGGRYGIGERLIKRFSKLQKQIGFKRKFRNDFPTLYGGSTYWSISKKSMDYIFNYLEEHPNFFKRFKYSFCSEEIFFQTILVNSPLRDRIVNDNIRFIVWEERNGNFPANLDDTDYDSIKKSNALFARKFEFPYSENLLTKIKDSLSKN